MNKKEFKAILKRIRKPGNVLTHSEALKIQSKWLKIHGTGGCYYPYTSENDMIRDLKEYFSVA
jgi:hypothetical protein